MIISHRHRYIFFAVPKTGTHSVRRALREHMGEEDLEQVGLFVEKKFPFPEFKDVRHGHLSARQIRPVIGDNIFNAYFKFAFVRHPFSRFVSFCAFMGKDGAFRSDPLGFMRHIVRNVRPVNHILFRPQSDFLVDDAGKSVMDFVGRTEEMQASYDKVCTRLGLPRTDLERANTSEHDDEYDDPELRQWVSDFYRRDFELFDYRFDGHATEPA